MLSKKHKNIYMNMKNSCKSISSMGLKNNSNTSKSKKRFILFSYFQLHPNIRRVFIALLLLLLSFLGGFFARTVPGFANLYSHRVYRYFSPLFSIGFGIFPFSVVELSLYLFLLYLFFQFGGLFFRTTHRRILSELLALGTKLLALGSLLLFLYTYLCGINYYRDSFTKEAGIATRSYSIEELREVTKRIVKEVVETERELSFYQGYNSKINFKNDIKGTDTTPNNLRDNKLSGSPLKRNYEPTEKIEWSFLYHAGREGQRAVSALSEEYPRLSVPYPFPKPLLLSRILSVQHLTGVYSPFSVEANYNREMPRYNIPFTLCHELSHLAGYMQEEEANFIAFLACRGSEEPYFRYAAALSAFVYVGNELAKSDPTSYSTLYQQLPEASKKELKYEREFWDKYESNISEAAEQRNDAYLKAHGQSSGVRSYDHVTNLILWFYLDK